MQKVIFNPSPNTAPPFRFNASLEGNLFNFSVTWLVFGQRWYVNCYDSRGVHIFSLPLIGSPSALQLASLVSSTTGLVTVETADPHGLNLGDTTVLRMFGNTPSGFDGSFECAILDDVTFTYQLPESTGNPGTATRPGFAKRMVNLLGGYFTSNAMEFWQDGQQFIIYP